MKNKKIISIDLDGTLLNERMNIDFEQFPSDNLVSKENIKTLKKLQDLGHIVVINTGRSLAEASHIQKLIFNQSSSIYAIASNGAAIGDIISDKIIFSQKVNKKKLREVLEYQEKEFITDFGIFYINPQGKEEIIRRKTDLKDFWTNDELIPLKAYSYLLDGKNLNELAFERHKSELWSLFGDNVQITSSGFKMALEFTDHGISKATALKWLAKKENLTIKDCIHIGDSKNDLEALKVVGIPIGIIGTDPECLNIAKYKIENASFDGISKILTKLLIS